MAKGAQSKEAITQKILEMFPNSFINDKEIRIPMEEPDGPVQIKVSLTCAKTEIPNPNSSDESAASAYTSTADMVEPTEEEKKTVESLLQRLGLQ